MAVKRLTRSQQGFTLIELLVVIGIIAIILAVTIIALNPVKHFQDARNAQRQSDVTAILDAIYEYEAGTRGTLPTALQSITTGTAYDITSTTGASNVNLCTDLVTGGYIADLPIDPKTGTKSASTACGGTYDSKYTVTESAANNRFTISAVAEPSGTVSVSR